MNDVAVPLASVLAFCRLNVRFVLLQRPAVLRPNGPIYQAIDATTLQARNIETWPFFNQVIWLGLCIAPALLQCSIFWAAVLTVGGSGLSQVQATLTPTSDSSVAVKFDEFKILGLVSFYDSVPAAPCNPSYFISATSCCHADSCKSS